MRRSVIAFVLTTGALLAAPSAVNAAPKPQSAASCTVNGSVVDAVGLPTDEVINFMVSDSSGTSGWVLGSTPDGTWSVSVPAPAGPTTYQFVSRTWGPRGAKYNVFASCS